MLSMAAVVASEVASALGTYLPTTLLIAPPSGYQTPPVPPVTMLKESFSCLGWAPASAARTNDKASIITATTNALDPLAFIFLLHGWYETSYSFTPESLFPERGHGSPADGER